MRILVCVKRVPLTGGKMVLTADEQALETRHLGFTISPHEECGVEEAVRLVEQHGGEVCVLALGSAGAEQEVAGGRDVYRVTLPAVVTVLEGINLPRYPSVPAKLRARQKPVETIPVERPEPKLERL